MSSTLDPDLYWRQIMADDVPAAVPPRGHAEASPSGAWRWRHCPASIRLGRGRPRRPTLAAAEGTVAHQLAEDSLRVLIPDGRLPPPEAMPALPPHPIGRSITVDGFSVLVTETMAQHVDAYVNYALRQLRELAAAVAGTSGKLAIEFEGRLDLGFSFGFADVTAACRGSRGLVLDLKYGLNGVEAEDNDQLRLYAAALARRWDLLEVEAHIYHPRLARPARATLFEREHLEQMLPVYQAAAATIETAEPVIGTWCEWCPALPVCPAQHAAALEALRSVSLPPGFDAPTPRAAAKATQALSITDCESLWLALRDAVRFHALLEAELRQAIESAEARGEPAPVQRVELRRLRPRRLWASDDPVRAAATAELPPEIEPAIAALSPTELEQARALAEHIVRRPDPPPLPARSPAEALAILDALTSGQPPAGWPEEFGPLPLPLPLPPAVAAAAAAMVRGLIRITVPRQLAPVESKTEA